MDDRKSVLIVEDNLILNLLYESYFERLGFKTKGELVYAKTAVELAQKLNPDLIVMDIALEGELSGIDAIKQIRQFSDVPVLYITGNTDGKHIEQAKATNYLGFLSKPVEFENLKKNIRKHFDI